MAADVATRAAVLCCLFALLFSSAVPTVSGAWPWEVGLLKNKTSTTDAPTTANVTTDAPTPSTTTPAPPTTEPTPRSRSRSRSHPKKHHPQTTTTTTTTTPQPEKEIKTVDTAAAAEAPVPSAPPAAQPAPQFFPQIQPQPPAPAPEMSPIVIVDPDSYPDASRTYRSMYEQPFGGMYPPPMPYSPPLPLYSPPVPPPLPAYPAPYDPYSVMAYPRYQWSQIMPSYVRPYQPYPFAPVPTLGNYPTDYAPYPWWKPPVERVALNSVAAPGDRGGCSSEPKRDREELRPELMDAPADPKVEEPSPTHISLLPSYPPKADSPNTPRYDNREESSVPVQKPYAEAEQRNTPTSNNGYGLGENVGKENHILRNNPYQSASAAPYWPGYYEQGQQWPQYNQWQQWQGPQQAQYPYVEGPQYPSVVPSQKRQAPGYGWAGRQYA